MASEEEKTHTQLANASSSTSIGSVEELNASFPSKIDNLEYIPVEMLYRIFMNVNDIALLNLADTGYRFECIAKTVFKDKYIDQHFVFDKEIQKNREKYVELFSRFGRCADIKAIEAKGIRMADENNWLPQLLRNHTNQLQKLSLKNCKGVRHILRYQPQITHLKIQNADAFMYHLRLPNIVNLVKLELVCDIETDCLKTIIRANPALESLILHNPIGYIDGIMRTITKHLKQLKELILMDYSFEEDWPISEDRMSMIFNSLKHLQSFGLSLKNRYAGFIHRLGLECTNLKRLELVYICRIGNFGREMFEAIRRCQSIEWLTLSQRNYTNRIEALIEGLPNLRHFTLDVMDMPQSTAFVLSLLHRCPSIETITIDLHMGRIPDCFLNFRFFQAFNDIMQHPSGKIQFRERSKIVGFVSRVEIVKRGRRLHWFQYDASYNLSNTNLLDLAKPAKASVVAGAEKRNPINRIFDYLDLGSLCSFTAASQRCNRLVENYVQQHAQRNGTFTITDEFQFNGDGLQKFVKHIVNLRLSLVKNQLPTYLEMLRNDSTNLKKLWIRSKRRLIGFPQVRHLIIEEKYAMDLQDYSRDYPNIEILEFKAIVVPQKVSTENPLQFRNLKTCIFQYKNKNQMKMFRKLFKNTGTQLIPIKYKMCKIVNSLPLNLV